MSWFKKKEPKLVTEEIGKAGKLALHQAKSSIQKAYNQGRIVFRDEVVEYTNNQGETTKGNISKIAEIIHGNISDYLFRSTGDSRSSLDAIGVAPKDIEKILVEVREKK